MSLSIGVDIGGTKIAAGLVDEKGEIVRELRKKTPATDPAALAGVVTELAQQLQRESDEDVVGIGIGAAGFVDAGRKKVLFAPNVDWRDEPLAARVEEHVDLPVVVENDANAAAWGEYRFGAGEDSDDMLLVTVGTGVGGGIVHDGRLFRGGFGIAAEIGHMELVPNGIVCGCGQHGCWEQYASGRALVRSAREAIANGDEGSAALAALVDGDVERLTGPMVTQLAQQGDPLSVTIFTDVGRWLGQGIAALCAVLDPSVITIGGGVGEAGALLLDPAYEAFHDHLSARRYRPVAELRLAVLGNQAGLIGAADLAREDPI